jgi:alpha-beta hydrolase superfamily lysophospholipase
MTLGKSFLILPQSFTSHGEKLYGELLLPQEGERPLPAALLCHGMGTDCRSLKPVAREIGRRGIAAFIFDFSGHGKSGGVCEGVMATDVQAAFQHLCNHTAIDSRRVAVVGHSLGALAALLAAPGLEGIAAMVLLSPPGEYQMPGEGSEPPCPPRWKNLREAAGAVFEYPQDGFLPWLNPAHATIAWLWMKLRRYRLRINWHKYINSFLQESLSLAVERRKPCPLLWVLCTRDKRVPYLSSLRLYHRTPPPKELLVHRGGFHSGPLLPGRLRKRWISWLVSQLSASAEPLRVSR